MVSCKIEASRGMVDGAYPDPLMTLTECGSGGLSVKALAYRWPVTTQLPQNHQGVMVQPVVDATIGDHGPPRTDGVADRWHLRTCLARAVEEPCQRPSRRGSVAVSVKDLTFPLIRDDSTQTKINMA